MVAGYSHLRGNHCGSTALRNLLRFHGAEISEEMALGLGAGACFYFIGLDGQSPARFSNGRTGRLEELFLELTGAGLRMRRSDDPDESWRMARETVSSGRPAILICDLFHLDHYGNSAHFPGHAIVLSGFDDTHAYVSDTGFEQLQRTSLEGLARARHERHPYYPLSGEIIDLPPDGEIGDLVAAAPAAIERAAQKMCDPDLADLEGLPALRRFAEEIGSWPELIDDWQWAARFNYQVIERRGTGGGNFRAMYSRFLTEAGRPDAARACATAAARWTNLAAALYTASEHDQPDPQTWERIGDAADAVLSAEQHLWEQLAAEPADS